MNNISNNLEFKSWILRSWFLKEKHSEMPWYSNTVTIDNVLDYINTSKSIFPYTLSQLKDLWKDKNDLTLYFRVKTEEEIEEQVPEPQKIKQRTNKQYENATLKEIAKELNGITAAYAEILQEMGEDKIRSIFNDKEEILLNFDNIKLEAAKSFTNDLFKYKNNVLDFVLHLSKTQILTRYDFENITNEELYALNYLFGLDKDLVVEILLEDISTENNIYKTFQNFVSRKIFPHRRGKKSA